MSILTHLDLGGEAFTDQWLEDGKDILNSAKKSGFKPVPVEGYKLWVYVRQNNRVVEWALTKASRVVGAGAWGITSDGTPQEYGAAIAIKHRGKGLHRKLLAIFRHQIFNRPIESDKDKSWANWISWTKAGAVEIADDRQRLNPSDSWTGTPKQIAWAKDIRAWYMAELAWVREGIVATQRRDQSRASWSKAGSYAAIGDRYRALLWTIDETIPKIRSAKFWIDVRNLPPDRLVDEVRGLISKGLLKVDA